MLVVKATYAPIIIGYDTIVYDYTVPIVVTNDTIVVTGGVGFYGWLYTVHRPSYYGVSCTTSSRRRSSSSTSATAIRRRGAGRPATASTASGRAGTGAA